MDVYNTTARQIVDAVLGGYNGSIIAYGQTGTGKTFSMEGIRSVPELRGIIPMAFDQIFSYIKHAGTATQFLVRASYLEIYNEEIRDLLNPKGKRLDIKERSDCGVYVKDLGSFVVKDGDEMDALMSVGNKNRSVGFTEMNATSSRSHSIFSITVEASEKGADGSDHIRAGKLHLVDLAGSERQSKTGATGDRLKEATKINLSLSALGNVISALVDGKSSHIPYRDSKLTRLLQDSLGGNAKTLMIATTSPASYNFEETVSTLRYANRAKNIKNKPKVNEDPKDAMLREFQEEIKRLKSQLESQGGIDGMQEDAGQDNEQNAIESSARRSKSRLSKTGEKRISEEQLAVMQELVAQEKLAILASKDLEESEKNRLIQEAGKRVEELELERQARAELAQKLAQMEGKLLVGGINIIDHHEEQQLMLANRALELEERARKERILHMHLAAHEEANLQIEEEFSTLQEEANSKTKKIKKVWNMLMEQKAELKDLHQEHQRERESFLETIRALTIEIKMHDTIIQGWIPQPEQQLIDDCAEYDEMADRWRIAHMTHAGNHMRNRRFVASGKSHSSKNEVREKDWLNTFADVYLSYEVPGLKKKDPKKIKSKSAALNRAASKSKSSVGDISVPQARGLVGKQKHYA